MSLNAKALKIQFYVFGSVFATVLLPLLSGMVSVCDAFAFRVHISLQSSAPGDDTRVSRLLGQYQ